MKLFFTENEAKKEFGEYLNKPYVFQIYYLDTFSYSSDIPDIKNIKYIKACYIKIKIIKGNSILYFWVLDKFEKEVTEMLIEEV